MRPPPLFPRGPALATLRRVRGWTLQELAKATGVADDTISSDESGRREVPEERFGRLCAALGYSENDAEEMVRSVAERLRPPVSEGRRHPLAPPPEVTGRMRRLARDLGEGVERVAGEEMERIWSANQAEADRAKAEALVVRLRRYPQADRIRLVERSPAYRFWAMPEALGEESERVAAKGHTFARAWATLARRSAKAVRVPENWRPRLRAHALAFFANAQRVGNELREADLTWDQAWKAWHSSPAEGLPLREWRLLDLQASLRIDQRLWPQAIKLLQEAQHLTPIGLAARVQLKLARAWNEMGDPTSALAVLSAARQTIESGNDRRQRWVLAFHTAKSLLGLNRPTEARPFADIAQQLASEGGWELDLTRTLWLSGGVQLEQGNREAARATFSQVRREFMQRSLALDAALAGLDEAVILLSEGAHEEVRKLAREMVPIFNSEALKDEAFASWRLFFEAALQESATIELAQRVSRSILAVVRAPRVAGNR